MKSKNIFLISVLLILIAISINSYSTQAELCVEPTYSPEEVIRDCGCGGIQRRATFCNGTFTPWYTCSEPDYETSCNDGIDNDCDGLNDCADTECSNFPSCLDADYDGYTQDQDCDDNNPEINPSATEICNAKDDNCNNQIDEGITRECGSTEEGICQLGEETCYYGTWIECSAVYPKEETCNNQDDNCDGIIDENCVQQGIIKDSSLDSETQEEIIQSTNTESVATQEIETQETTQTAKTKEIVEQKEIAKQLISEKSTNQKECIDQDGDGFGVNCNKGIDCDDFDVTIHPFAKEACNARDDNCNNIVDESLERQCGITEIGTCVYGKELCVQGKWSGCSATLPSTEVCENNKDDDCDGQVDEECQKTKMSNENIALNQFLKLEHGEKYNLNDIIEAKKKTAPFIITQKKSVAKDKKTIIEIKIKPTATLKNITIYEYIPKELAKSVSEIKFKVPPKVIQDDPLVAWHFAELKDTVDLSYELQKEVEDAADKTSTIAFAEEVIMNEEAEYVTFLPLLFIPIIGLLFISLVEALKRRTHKK